jgi:TolA-binding protein
MIVMQRVGGDRGDGGAALSSKARGGELRRRGALLLALAGTLPLAGCATKKDLKLLRDEMIVLQARQDSLFNEFSSSVMDTLRSNTGLLLRVRGDLGNQLLSMEEQLIQIQELTGQGQRQLGELRQQWQARSQEGVPVAGGADVVVTAMGEGEVEQTYALGRQKCSGGSITTARAAFASILSGAPTHPLAPDAQLQIAETYVAEENYAQAYKEFERMIELFANSPSAPTALYRAGLLAKEQGDTDKARTYFSRVQSGYGRSDVARLAGEELRRLRPRR